MMHVVEQFTSVCHTQLFCMHMPEDCHSNNLLKQQGEEGKWDKAGALLPLLGRQLSDIDSFCHAWT